jgi:hypothetical protein
LKSAEELLFLQKKKEKNSYLLRVVAITVNMSATYRSFLLLFFKKEVLSFSYRRLLSRLFLLPRLMYDRIP